MGWEVLYPFGSAPTLDRLQTVLDRDRANETRGAAIAIERLVNPASGYPTIECMVGGLGFDVAVLGEWNRDERAEIEHIFGVERGDLVTCSGLSIVPGPNIAAMAHAMPVVRAGALLVRRILALGDPLAVVWRPIGSAMEPGYFNSIVDGWLDGGPFPALGLAAMRSAPDGGLHSHGLALFTGQELRLDPALAESGTNALSLAARLIDRLVESEPVTAPFELLGEDGRTLRLSPSTNGRFVVVEPGD